MTKNTASGNTERCMTAFVNRGLGIHGCDYPRTVKWVKTADNEGKLSNSVEQHIYILEMFGDSDVS